MYQAKRLPRQRMIAARKHQHHVLQWGIETKPLLLLCHGWMDVAASFQFLVDAFSQDFVDAHHIVALDWRGYGLSSRTTEDSYWFADYVGDLDAVIDALSPTEPIDLLGHSMGGNVVMLYAGVRPTRIRRLMNLEGFGMPDAPPEQAPSRYARWLDAIKLGESMSSYHSLGDVAARLMKNNPRLSLDRAQWLATHWASETKPGLFEINGDPAHKLPSPVGYRLNEVLACWQQITAPVMVVEGGQTDLTQWYGQRYTLDDFHQRLKAVAQCQVHRIQAAGHMLHHEQPEQLALLVTSHCA